MKRSLFLAIILVTCCKTFAQQDSIAIRQMKKFVQNIYVFERLYPQEKVYLHFDNTAYFLGETIWFKAYLATAENLKPSPFSKVMYVELLSPEGYILNAKKLKAENGQCHGDFALPDSLHAGFYEVRAYTRAMMNFGEDVVFSRVFPVFNKPAKAGVYEKKMTLRNPRRSIPDQRAKAPQFGKLNLQFFPEGGNLVQGLLCTVAFKATGEQGQGVEVNGKIYNDQNEAVVDLTTIHQGMGSFSFLPAGKTYKAKVQYQGKEYTFALPQTLSAGYALNVQNLRPDEVGVKIQKTPDLPEQPLGITLICRGKLLLFRTFSFDSSSEYTLNISKTELPAGINQITLFDVKGEILAERLFFVPPKKDEKVKIEPHLRNNLEPYGLVNVDFDVKNHAGQPVKTTFSLSVRDAATDIPSANATNMQSYFLLASDLKGYVEQPDYYFEADDNQHRIAADLLMMTQGWRRYEWKTMAGMKPFEVKYPIEESIIADGSILSPAKSKPVPDVDVTMWAYSPEGTSKHGKCTTDTAGRFNFDLENIYGEWDMSLQVKRNNKPEACRILLNRAFTPQAKAFLPLETELSEIKNNVLTSIKIKEDTIENQLPEELPDMQSKTHPLPEVVVKAKKSYHIESEGLAFADVAYDVGKTSDDLIDRNEDVNIDILDFITQNNKYFTYYDEIVNSGKDKDITITHCLYKGNRVLFVVDNMVYNKFQTLGELTDRGIYNCIMISESGNVSNSLNPDIYEGDIRSLNVYDIKSMMISEDRGAAIRYCPECNPGRDYVTIFLYTRVNDKKRFPPGMRQTTFQGYSVAREFYQPEYDERSLPKEQDVRRTLYWNPDVKTNSNGSANIQFYNNAVCKDINVDTDGIY